MGSLQPRCTRALAVAVRSHWVGSGRGGGAEALEPGRDGATLARGAEGGEEGEELEQAMAEGAEGVDSIAKHGGGALVAKVTAWTGAGDVACAGFGTRCWALSGGAGKWPRPSVVSRRRATPAVGAARAAAVQAVGGAAGTAGRAADGANGCGKVGTAGGRQRRYWKQTKVAHGGNGRAIKGIENKIGVK